MTHPLADELRAAEHAEASDIGRVPVCKIAKATLSTAALLIDRLYKAVSEAYEDTASALEIRANEIEPGEMDAEEVKEWLLGCASAIRAHANGGK